MTELTEPDRPDTDERVLVLDATYTPVSVMHWTKAVTLLLTDPPRADPVVESARIISSPSVQIWMPSVIRLRSTVTTQRRRIALARRRAIFELHNWTCAYCGHKAKGSAQRRELTIDHVMPTSRGGSKTDPLNQVPACRPCNARKADQTPEEARMPLLFPPREPRWHERFAMSFKANDGRLPQAWEEFMPSF